MAGKKVLVPYNFTRHDERTLHFIMQAYAGYLSVQVTLFHVYRPLLKETSLNPAIEDMYEYIEDRKEELESKKIEISQIMASLYDNGFFKQQLDVVFKSSKKSIGREIARMMKEGSYDTVVLSRMKKKGVNLFTENIHLKVLRLVRDKVIIIIN